MQIELAEVPGPGSCGWCGHGEASDNADAEG